MAARQRFEPRDQLEQRRQVRRIAEPEQAHAPQIAGQADAPRHPGEGRRRLAGDEGLRRAALALARLGGDMHGARGQPA
jgi:hypothetical protein